MVLVAVNSLVATISGLTISVDRAKNWPRWKDEPLLIIVLRFRDLAADHLIPGCLSFSSLVGTFLGIILLNNALLSKKSLIDAMLPLTALAEAITHEDAIRSHVQELNNAEIKAISEELEVMFGKPHLRQKKEWSYSGKFKVILSCQRFLKYSRSLDTS